MALIPLHCNLCPREPSFSDVSHLLTHVASKGHLAHQFNVGVRGRSDIGQQQKLAIYNAWYERYHIGRLLQQRLASKDHRRRSNATQNVRIQDNTALPKTKKPRRRSSARVKRAPSIQSPFKSEDVIDPQLMEDSPLAQRLPAYSYSPDKSGAQENQNYMRPRLNWRMTDHQSREASNDAFHSSPLSHKRAGRSSETHTDIHETFAAFMQSPPATSYPPIPPISSILDFNTPQHRHSFREENNEAQEHLPVLKGIKWPGMSLFDSASLEAQRLRNQKKDGSVLEQMEVESTSIQPLENIYWPEWDLKQSRPITGNVESSPPKDMTPPKRVIPKKRKALANRSTNISNVPKRRGRKSVKTAALQHRHHFQEGDMSLEDPHTVDPNDMHPRHSILDETHVRGHGRVSAQAYRKPSFDVFTDNGAGLESYPTGPHDNSFFARGHDRKHADEPMAPMSNARLIKQEGLFDEDISLSSLQHKEFASFFRPRGDNKENDPWSHEGHPRQHIASPDPLRVTQRYFWAQPDHPTQFYNAMPPRMEFGGYTPSAFHRPMPNPLNRYLDTQYTSTELPTLPAMNFTPSP